MRYALFILFVSCLGAAVLGAQTPASEPIPQPASVTRAQTAGQAPTDADIYCAGFFTRRAIAPDLVILGGSDYGLRFEYGDRDMIHLNKGAETIKSPGGKYMVLRPLKDMNPTEPFPGQRELVARMGTLYAEIARIQINIIHKDSSTAEILSACEPVIAGDIAVPLSPRPAPPYKQARIADRFAPSSGKATGTIAAIKEFREGAGTGDVVYVNLGAQQVKPGEFLRITRTFQSPSQYIVQQGTRYYLTDINGVPVGRQLTSAEAQSLPRTVVGEMMILSAQENSSTGIISYSWQDIYPGDQVEVE